MNMKRIKLAIMSGLATLTLLTGTASAHVGEHRIESGDSLSKIAAAHDTNWRRLWLKNPSITNPNLIFAGNTLVVPDPAEVLEAAVQPPQAPAAPVVPKTTPSAPKPAPVPARTASRPASGGPNLFDKGSCTWWVKHWRPNINWNGNANRWHVNAAAKGWTVNGTPSVGAVGVTTRGKYGHVVLVTAILGGGRITIKEGNYDFGGSVRSRTTNSSEFPWYIH